MNLPYQQAKLISLESQCNSLSIEKLGITYDVLKKYNIPIKTEDLQLFCLKYPRCRVIKGNNFTCTYSTFALLFFEALCMIRNEHFQTIQEIIDSFNNPRTYSVYSLIANYQGFTNQRPFGLIMEMLSKIRDSKNSAIDFDSFVTSELNEMLILLSKSVLFNSYKYPNPIDFINAFNTGGDFGCTNLEKNNVLAAGFKIFVKYLEVIDGKINTNNCSGPMAIGPRRTIICSLDSPIENYWIILYKNSHIRSIFKADPLKSYTLSYSGSKYEILAFNSIKDYTKSLQKKCQQAKLETMKLSKLQEEINEFKTYINTIVTCLCDLGNFALLNLALCTLSSTKIDKFIRILKDAINPRILTDLNPSHIPNINEIVTNIEKNKKQTANMPMLNTMIPQRRFIQPEIQGPSWITKQGFCTSCNSEKMIVVKFTHCETCENSICYNCLKNNGIFHQYILLQIDIRSCSICGNILIKTELDFLKSFNQQNEFILNENPALAFSQSVINSQKDCCNCQGKSNCKTIIQLKCSHRICKGCLKLYFNNNNKGYRKMTKAKDDKMAIEKISCSECNANICREDLMKADPFLLEFIEKFTENNFS